MEHVSQKTITSSASRLACVLLGGLRKCSVDFGGIWTRYTSSITTLAHSWQRAATVSPVRISAYWVEPHLTLNKQVNSSLCSCGDAASVQQQGFTCCSYITAGHFYIPTMLRMGTALVLRNHWKQQVHSTNYKSNALTLICRSIGELQTENASRLVCLGWL